jgi:hypothetical protein
MGNDLWFKVLLILLGGLPVVLIAIVLFVR